MILLSDRKLVTVLIQARLWKFKRSPLWEQPTLYPCWGTRWLFDLMRKRQTRDGLHHAPKCNGNEWSGMQLVVAPCNCGAARLAKGRRRFD